MQLKKYIIKTQNDETVFETKKEANKLFKKIKEKVIEYYVEIWIQTGMNDWEIDSLELIYEKEVI